MCINMSDLFIPFNSNVKPYYRKCIVTKTMYRYSLCSISPIEDTSRLKIFMSFNYTLPLKMYWVYVLEVGQGHDMVPIERACHKDHACQISLLHHEHFRRYEPGLSFCD